ncbi:MAG: hypothetical protein KN64_01470 [Sulfurovum sp. AS07-7]|nr:MAG: hypothetical protein KN64_01470 [Sulfurovum sp. AS07-7]
MSDKDKNNNTKNPYLDGRREWNERYGSYISQAKTWRLFAISALALSALSVVGVIYIGSQSKIKPYIVEVDKLGQSIHAGYAPQMEYDERVIKYGLSDFITNFRTVYKKDTKIQKEYAKNAYKYLSKGTLGYGQVTEEYKSNNPLTAKYDKNVEITSVLRLGENSYQIDWVEKTFNEAGHLITTDNYKAIANIQIEAPKTEDEIINNPIGLFIKSISFQKLIK